jgi:hypothetical protein
MIDPSTLEGDELETWYLRSPADVEAEREAARQARYDAFVRSIGGASSSPEASNEERNGAAGASVGQTPSNDSDPRLITAYYRPIGPGLAPPVMVPPSGPLAGPSVDARGGPVIGASGSGFFGTHDYSPALGGYFTDLPSPLNSVTPKANPNWFELGDGSLAQRGEVERVYAEQQRRLKGQQDVPPASNLRPVDRLADGYVPRADQVARGERELDPTCAPNGGWERDPGFNSSSDRTKQYEAQITRAPGLDYVVRNPGQPPVKFDGCAVWDPHHPLLEAKGPGYASLMPKSIEWGFYGNMLKGAVDQAGRQAGAAPNQRIEWHVAEPGALEFFEDATAPDRPPIVVQQTRARVR